MEAAATTGDGAIARLASIRTADGRRLANNEQTTFDPLLVVAPPDGERRGDVRIGPCR